MDEAVGLQVPHALADIQTHTKQVPLVKAAPPLPEEVQQTALLHELCDDVDWPLLAAHAVQLHQFGVGQIPGEGGRFVNRNDIFQAAVSNICRLKNLKCEDSFPSFAFFITGKDKETYFWCSQGFITVGGSA